MEQAQAQALDSPRREATDRDRVAAARAAGDPTDVLSADEWRKVDAAVARALAWLAAQQEADGSFPTLDLGQPGVTSLCVMAFLAYGHVPGEGQYGPRLERAVDYVLRCQKRNGLVSLLGLDDDTLSRIMAHEIGETACYNHGIASLMLSESFGMSAAPGDERLQEAIARSVAVTLLRQRWPRDDPGDRGGWRYLDDTSSLDSDLSVSGWELMFLRSARNAGFAVPAEPINDAVGYVRRCFDQRAGVFRLFAKPSRAKSRNGGRGDLGVGACRVSQIDRGTRIRRLGAQVSIERTRPIHRFQGVVSLRIV
jgi:hypothetical protein